MLSGLGQSDGLVDRLIVAGGSADATLLAGIAIVVGMMLWAAGARAVSLAFAAAGGTAGLFVGFTIANQINVPDVAGLPGSLIVAGGGAALGVVISLVAMRLVIAAAAGITAAAAIAGLAVVLTPHLPPQGTNQPTSQSPLPVATQPAAFDQDQSGLAADGWDTGARPDMGADALQPQGHNLDIRAISDQAQAAWKRVPEGYQGQAAIAILAGGLLGAMLGAIWPARIASATTAFMGAAIWPLGAIHMQAAAGTPLSIAETPIQTWLIAWLVLGVIGLGIQRLVVRKVAEN